MSRRVSQSIRVRRSVSDVWQLWSDFERFPEFMDEVRQVRVTGPGTTHWVARGPLGLNFEWTARTTAREENRLLAWESTGGDVRQSGEVRFGELGPEETKVTLTLQYDPPGGRLGSAVARLMDRADAHVARDLENFKAYAERATV